MPARVSEAFVLQTWPFKEGDLIVSFLTRDSGKLRGVARRARRPKSGFGSGLERLSHIKMSYFQRENRELVNIDSCDLLHSQFGMLNDFASACALDFVAEVSEQLLPAAEPSEKYFRLRYRRPRTSAIRRTLRASGRPSPTSASGPCVSPACSPNCMFASAAAPGWKIPNIPSARFSAASAPASLPRLPPRARSPQHLGTHRRIPRHRRGDPAHAHRATSPTARGLSPPPPTCAVSSPSRWKLTSSAS